MATTSCNVKTRAVAALCCALAATASLPGANAAYVTPQQDSQAAAAAPLGHDLHARQLFDNPCFPFTCENSVCNAETKQCDCDEGYLHDFSGLQCIKAPADGKLYPLCSGDDVSACGIEVNDDGATISPSVFGSQVTCCPKGSTGYLDKDGTQKCSAPCGAGEGGAGSASSTEPAEETPTETETEEAETETEEETETPTSDAAAGQGNYPLCPADVCAKNPLYNIVDIDGDVGCCPGETYTVDGKFVCSDPCPGEGEAAATSTAESTPTAEAPAGGKLTPQQELAKIISECFAGIEVPASTGATPDWIGNCGIYDACMGEGVGANDAAANAGAEANDGALGNDGALSTIVGEIFGNDGFASNDGAAAGGLIAAPEGFDAADCPALVACGVFDNAQFASCSAPAPVTAERRSAELCREVFVGDGVCDSACNLPQYGFDGGDC